MKSWESESDSDLILRSHNQLVFVNHFNIIDSDTSCVWTSDRTLWGSDQLLNSHCKHFTTNDPPRYRLFFLQLFKLAFIRSFKKLTVVWFSRTGMTRAADKIQLLLDSFFFFKTIATITHSVIILVVPNTLCHGNQTKIAHRCSPTHLTLGN